MGIHAIILPLVLLLFATACVYYWRSIHATMRGVSHRLEEKINQTGGHYRELAEIELFSGATNHLLFERFFVRLKLFGALWFLCRASRPFIILPEEDMVEFDRVVTRELRKLTGLHRLLGHPTRQETWFYAVVYVWYGRWKKAEVVVLNQSTLELFSRDELPVMHQEGIHNPDRLKTLQTVAKQWRYEQSKSAEARQKVGKEVRAVRTVTIDVPNWR